MLKYRCLLNLCFRKAGMTEQVQAKNMVHFDKYLVSKLQKLKYEIMGEVGQKMDEIIQQIDSIENRMIQLQQSFEKHLSSMKQAYCRAHSNTLRRKKFKAFTKDYNFMLENEADHLGQHQGFNQFSQNKMEQGSQGHQNEESEDRPGKKKRRKVNKTMKGVFDILQGVRTKQQVAKQLKVSYLKLDAILARYSDQPQQMR